ncbi:Uncharacterised protein [Yersinia pseudotuberculosis]|nr:Uncharacterised protein [Yersinia pseudotuberculosis]CNK29951.1 Uncharacterised protein [Yersinia pseudotuberculosis]
MKKARFTETQEQQAYGNGIKLRLNQFIMGPIRTILAVLY